jgi:hypothetical protein
MTSPRGRDNGLPPATRYVALVDVDPPVADHVLALLRDAGVTAVAEPLGGEPGPARDAAPPTRPTDRVHVDLGHVLLARNVVGRALPSLRADFHADAARRSDAADAESEAKRRAELAPDIVDSLFADIVAGFAEPSTDPVPRWSVLEDATPSSDADDEPEPEPRRGLSSRLVRRGHDSEQQPAPEEDLEGHFVPEPPPPLPAADPITRLAWAALLGGPILIVLAALLQISLESWVVVLALAGFVGGFATLVARMRDRPRQDDGWDDGAVL